MIVVLDETMGEAPILWPLYPVSDLQRITPVINTTNQKEKGQYGFIPVGCFNHVSYLAFDKALQTSAEKADVRNFPEHWLSVRVLSGAFWYMYTLPKHTQKTA
jgi:hypothetical protein